MSVEYGEREPSHTGRISFEEVLSEERGLGRVKRSRVGRREGWGIHGESGEARGVESGEDEYTRAVEYLDRSTGRVVEVLDRKRSRGFLRYSNDVIFAGHCRESPENRPSVLSRCLSLGLLAVGTTGGDLSVISVKTGKVTNLEQRQQSHATTSTASGCRITSVCIGEVDGGGGTVAMVVAGHESGLVRLWLRDQGGNFVFAKDIVGCHATRIVCLRIVGKYILSVDDHGRMLTHAVLRLVTVPSVSAAGGLLSYSGNLLASSIRRQLVNESSCSSLNSSLMEAIGKVRGVIVGAEEDLLLVTQAGSVVLARVEENGRVVASDAITEEPRGHPDAGRNIRVSACWRSATSRNRECLVAVARGKVVELTVKAVNVVNESGKDRHIYGINDEEKEQKDGGHEPDVFSVFECPGLVQDLEFLHGGEFLGVVHYDDDSGKTLVSLVCLRDIKMKDDGNRSLRSKSTSSRSEVDLCDVYVQGTAVGGGDSDEMVLLTGSGVRCVQLMSWKQKLSALVGDKLFNEALLHALSLYQLCKEDTRADEVAAWPANRAKVEEAHVVSKQSLSLLRLFIEKKMGDMGSSSLIDYEDVTSQENSSMEKQRLVQLAIDACMVLNSMDVFYGDLRPLFETPSGYWDAYLDVILQSDQSFQVPPQIIQSLVERVASMSQEVRKSALQILESALLGFDVSSIDLNQVIPLCITHRMYSVIIYVFSRGMKDFKTPAALLFASAVVEHGQGKSIRLAMKLLVYIYACFRGVEYPLREVLDEKSASDDDIIKMRLDILEFVLFSTVSEIQETVELWESVQLAHVGSNGPSGDQASICEAQLLHLKNTASPVLHFLCQVDVVTTLSLLRNLLSTWDAMEADLGGTHVEQTRTLSQATVDCVVSMINMQDISFSGDQAAKLEFVVDLVSSSRASLPPVGVMSLLTYLCEVAKVDATKIASCEEKFLQIVSGSPGDHCSDKLLDLVHAAGFSSAEAEILIRKGYYEDAIRCFLDSKGGNIQLLNHLKDIVGQGGAVAKAFTEALLPEFPRIVSAGSREAAIIAIDIIPHEQNQILTSLEIDTEAQYRFLEAVITLLQERGDSKAREASPWMVSFKTKTMSNRYVSLMCRFEPDNVLQFLRSNSTYDIGECIKCCQEYRLRGALAYLLDRQGDFDGSLEIYLEEMQEFVSQMICSNSAANEYIDTIMARANAACTAAISLCTRYSQGSTDVWKDILMVYAAPYVQNRAIISTEIGKNLLGCIEMVVQAAAGHTDISCLMDIILDIFVEVPYRDIKDVLGILATALSFEVEKARLMSSISKLDCRHTSHDVYAQLRRPKQ
jgi:hypothetical protein